MTDEWETPQDLYDDLNEEFNFTLDPCCTKETAKHFNYYTKQDNGLQHSWRGEVVFLNPPYSDITSWVKKAWNEYLSNATVVVALLPAWTDRIWFHKYVYKKADDIRFLKGRVKFLQNGRPYTSPIFGSMVVIWK